MNPHTKNNFIQAPSTENLSLGANIRQIFVRIENLWHTEEWKHFSSSAVQELRGQAYSAEVDKVIDLLLEGKTTANLPGIKQLLSEVGVSETNKRNFCLNSLYVDSTANNLRNYFSNYTTASRIDDAIGQRTTLPLDQQIILQSVTDHSVLTGAFLAGLLIDLADASSPLSVKLKEDAIVVRGWLNQLFSIAAECESTINQFFDTFIEPAKRDCDVRLVAFLEAWRRDTLLPIYDSVLVGGLSVINAARAGGIGSQVELLSPYPRDTSTREPMPTQTLLSLFDSAFSTPFFSWRKPLVKNHLLIEPNNKVVLTNHEMSPHDLIAFVGEYGGFWKYVLTELKSNRHSTEVRIGEDTQLPEMKVRFGSSAYLFIRPQGNRFGQARIALRILDGKYQGFTPRVDLENNGNLSFDFGEVTALGAIKNMTEQIITKSHRAKMRGVELARFNDRYPYYNFRDDVDPAGKFKRAVNDPMSRAHIMGSARVNGFGLTLPERMSLMGSLVSKLGETFGIRQGNSMSYHFRETLTDAELARDFGPIANSLFTQFDPKKAPRRRM